MKAIRRISVIMIMIAFALNATVSVAMAGCLCGNMAKADMISSEMPCHDMAQEHDMAKEDIGQPDDGEKQASKCTKCACSHCEISSQASLNQQPAANVFFESSAMQMRPDDKMVSTIIFGIDNPPKHIS